MFINLRIFDKDGTLVITKSNNKYPKLGDQKLIKSVERKVIEFHNAGDIIAVATNQAGVKFGFKSIDSVYGECEELITMLPVINLILFCPDYGKECWGLSQSGERIAFHEIYGDLVGSFRKGKPGEREKSKPLLVLRKHGIIAALDATKRYLFPEDLGQGGGMFSVLMREYHISIENTYYYGNMRSDKDAASAAGVKYVDVKELMEIENG